MMPMPHMDPPEPNGEWQAVIRPAPTLSFNHGGVTWWIQLFDPEADRVELPHHLEWAYTEKDAKAKAKQAMAEMVRQRDVRAIPQKVVSLGSEG